MCPAREGSEKITTILDPEMAEQAKAAGAILVQRRLLPPARYGAIYPTKYGLGKYALEMLVDLVKFEEGIPDDEQLSFTPVEMGETSPEQE